MQVQVPELITLTKFGHLYLADHGSMDRESTDHVDLLCYSKTV